jgi:hypothetical protein
MGERTNIDRAALDAMILIAKKAGIRRNKGTMQLLAGIQIIVADAICQCLPPTDKRLKERL